MGQADSAILALAIVASGYLITLCATPPNPPPEEKDRHGTDRIRWLVGSPATVSRRIVMAMAVYHALLIVVPEYAPARMQQICPRPQNLNSDLFTWSSVSTASLLSIFAGALVRLAAYGGLGEYFTFHLAAPGQLVTTGVYRWIQHPSYTGVFLLILGETRLFVRWDASPACFIAGSSLDAVRGLGLGVYVAGFMFGTWTLMVRVRDEEEMLRQHFGKQWEEWHRATKRFIPGLF
ncbi:Phospholipid methyltransferase [Penicillium capsulatum]|uniref:Protein-S-isoprenylcysteine O-methyltransferase n=1 Tax=Penicillium capsulatum TaxID=69766 RepID=A0A9W9ILU5_9EURO|nr:Phospholipid methyltransferase [Penicillium capsulatum]KAJ6122074.1 Phospholipid methyltransferase [Penicillium capsulatum]